MSSEQPSAASMSPELRISAAFNAALALAEILKGAPFAAPADYELLRDAALLATAREAKAAPYWVGQTPEWAPHTGSALEGIAWLGRRLTCLAAAAARTHPRAEDFLEAITNNWPDVQQFVAQHYNPVPHGVLECGLRREVRETAERPVNLVPVARWTDGGWLDEGLTALEEWTAQVMGATTKATPEPTLPAHPQAVPGEVTGDPVGEAKQLKWKAQAASSAPLEALVGEWAQEVLKIARSEDMTADAKMRTICGMDRRFRGFNSKRWAELLGVTDNAVRQTDFWKKDRKEADEED